MSKKETREMAIFQTFYEKTTFAGREVAPQN